MTTIADRLNRIRARIQGLQNPNAAPVTLIAVSKTFPADAVQEAAQADQKAFGENYVQEGVDKIEQLKALDLEWHFIGPLQSNKAKAVAQYFDWVHSIDRLKIAQRLSANRPVEKPPLNICLQINVSGEESKSGIPPEEAVALAKAVHGLPRLKLRGLMAIPEPTDDLDLLRQRFRLLKQIQTDINQTGLSLDTLSMGMSNDMEIAIEEGATMVRVGSAIFGYRPRKPAGAI